MESVGFKEWAIVCEALGRGEQSIILRKGGIAEGRDGFMFRHPEFFLFPTYFHEQVEKTRVASREIPPRRDGEIEIRFFVKVEASAVVTSWETAVALEPGHVWQREVVRERFDYDDLPGIHVALVRVFRLLPSWIFSEVPSYRGCRSWVPLPTPPEGLKFEPALSDREHDQRREKLQAMLATSARSPEQGIVR